MTSGITTHVLDTSTGRPAARVAVVLDRRTDGTWQRVAGAITDDDGRCRDLGPADAQPGIYRLTFATGDWFATAGRSAFHPEITVTFTVTDARHHHVPLLVAPFGYSTYRGS
ncbi:MAG: hydroxyisourate hydrolase [Actinomycetales bacterium]